MTSMNFSSSSGLFGTVKNIYIAFALVGATSSVQAQNSNPTSPPPIQTQAPSNLTQIPHMDDSAPRALIDPNADLLLQYGTEASVYRALSKKLEAQLQAINRQRDVERAAPGLKRKPGPVLLAVEGLKSRGFTAHIEIIPGAIVEARVGTLLPDGSVVEGINFESVTLKKGRAKSTVLTVPQFQDEPNTFGRFMTSEQIKQALEFEKQGSSSSNSTSIHGIR